MMSSTCWAASVRPRASRGFSFARRISSADDRAAFVAIVAEQHGGRARVQLLDLRKAQQAEQLAPDDDEERQARQRGKRSADPAERHRAREQVLDQPRDRKAKRRARPGRPAPTRTARPSESALRAGGATSSGTGAANASSSVSTRMPLGLLLRRRRDGHGRIVEPERGRPAALLVGRHSSLSPIRNCSARSMRMCGSAGAAVRSHAPAAAGGSAGSGSRRCRGRSTTGP